MTPAALPQAVAARRWRLLRAPVARGLTLVELLVTIVIMVTVLAGVIPMLSPNNDARKIREAARQMSTLLAQAQAQAARDGRPVGVAFRESGSGNPFFSGMAVEAYFIAEPKPYAGFADNSYVRIRFLNGQARTLQFVLGGRTNEDANPQDNPEDLYVGFEDPVPPNTLRYGDRVFASGFEFEIVDGDQDGDGQADTSDDPPRFVKGDYYTNTEGLRASYECKYVGDAPLMPRVVYGASAGDGWSSLMIYRVIRQPVNTADAPHQFPRGVGIDLQSSSAEGPGFPIDFDAGGADTVAVLFSPTGAIDSVIHRGVRRTTAQHVYLLIGKFQNANSGSQAIEDFNFADNPPPDADNLAQRRGRINWLNADSRWVSVARNGRIITADNNTSFNPALSPYIDEPFNGTTPEERANEQRMRHLGGARKFAAQMLNSGGR